MEKMKQKTINALKWSEKYIKTDMVYLAKGGFWNILSQIIVSGSTFLLAIGFAHFISKEAYGQYKFILSIASILATFTLTGINVAVLQAVNRGYEGTMQYTFWKNLRWSILFCLLCLGVSIYYFVHGNVTIGTSMLVVGSLSPFWNSSNLYNSYLEAKKDFRRSAIYFNIIGNLFPTLCLFIGIIFTSNPLWLVIIYFSSNTLIGIILYLRVVNIYKPNKDIDTGALSYSKHLSFMGILSGVMGNLDQILVYHYVGAAELAIYNFAIAIPAQIKGPMKGLASLIFPKFVERSNEEIRRGMKNKFLVLFISAVLIISTYILIAPFIYHTFFPKYSDSILYSQIYSLSLFLIVCIPTESYLVAKKKIKEQYINNITIPIVQTVLLFVGIIWGGLLGLVIARVTITIFTTLLSIALYEKASKSAD